MHSLVQDFRFGARILAKNPGFTTVAVLTLTLGIGATTTIFSVLDAAILRPLSVVEPERLVILQPPRRADRFVLFNPLFEELRQNQRSLTGIFAVQDAPYLKVNFDRATSPAYVRGSLVSANYFSVLGVSPAFGRLLVTEDDRRLEEGGSTDCGAVISYDLAAYASARRAAKVDPIVTLRYE